MFDFSIPSLWARDFFAGWLSEKLVNIVLRNRIAGKLGTVSQRFVALRHLYFHADFFHNGLNILTPPQCDHGVDAFFDELKRFHDIANALPP